MPNPEVPQRVPKCPRCNSDMGYFSDATYRAVLLHGWDGKPRHDLTKMNMVWRERNFRCAKCKTPIGHIPRVSDAQWDPQ